MHASITHNEDGYLKITTDSKGSELSREKVSTLPSGITYGALNDLCNQKYEGELFDVINAEDDSYVSFQMEVPGDYLEPCEATTIVTEEQGGSARFVFYFDL